MRMKRTMNILEIKKLGRDYPPSTTSVYRCTYEITWTPLSKKNEPTTIRSHQTYYATDELDAYNKCMREKS